MEDCKQLCYLNVSPSYEFPQRGVSTVHMCVYLTLFPTEEFLRGMTTFTCLREVSTEACPQLLPLPVSPEMLKQTLKTNSFALAYRLYTDLLAN